MKLDKEQVLYRKAIKSDALELSICRADFLDEILNNFDNPQRPVLLKELEIYFSEKLEKEELVAWLAVYNNEIISTSSMVIWDVPLGYSGIGKGARRGYVLNMYTKKAFRRNGLSALLLKKLEEEGRALNLELLHLNATDDGMGIYKSNGYKESQYPELKLKLS